MQSSLDCMAWEEFIQSYQDINELMVSSQVSYCKVIVIPEKVVRIYNNSKPWASRNPNV